MADTPAPAPAMAPAASPAPAAAAPAPATPPPPGSQAAARRLFAPASDATPASQLSADQVLDLDGIAVTRRGDVYFGQIVDEKNAGRVMVTVPTAQGTVRTIRHLNRADILRVQELKPGQILALAKLGGFVLTQAQLEKVIKPDPAPKT